MTEQSDRGTSARDDAFVWAGGDAGARAPARLGTQRSGQTPRPPEARPAKGLLRRADGRVTRRMTMYLDPELARRLVMHCAATGQEISDVAAAALRDYLASQAAR